MAQAKFSIRDNSREITRTDLNIVPVTVGNLGQVLTDFGALRTAIGGIILGVVAKEALVLDETNLTAASPTDPLAQRGIKWKVLYADNQPFFDPPVNAIPNAGYQNQFTNSIGTAKLSLLGDGEEDLDLTTGPGLEFVTRFEAIVRSPYGGTVEVLRVYYSD